MNTMNTQFLDSVQPRPEWLERATLTEQTEYAELEKQLTVSQLAFDKQLGSAVSVKAHAHKLISQAITQAFGLALDPDTITTNTRYVFEVGGRSIVQEDTRTLTELAMCGLHDANARGTIVFSGNGLPLGFNQQWFEQALRVDVRADHVVELKVAFQRGEVISAMSAVTQHKLLLSAFAARLQGHLNDESLGRIRRAINGDASLIIGALELEAPNHNARNRPLKDLVAIGTARESQDDWLLYAPGSPAGQDWFQLPSFWRLNGDIAQWVATEKGRDYLTWQSHAMDREAIGSYLKQVSKLPVQWRHVRLVPSSYQGEEVLLGLINNHRAWLVAEEEFQTPYRYRTASDVQRQLFLRLNCELKALQTVNVRQGGFISYETFCVDLIKQRVEQVLLERGERVAINPDQIKVEIDLDQQMSLTQLIINEVHFYASGAGTTRYPRFTLANSHPPVEKLDILDIASWSRTLRPGEQYIDMLRSVHLDRQHPEGSFKRQVHLQILKRKMNVAMLQALFNGRLNSQHLPEMSKVISQLESPQPPHQSSLGELPGEVRHSALFNLHLQGRLVVGVFVFRLVVSGSVVEYLFTADAPDGIELRAFSEFVPAVKSGSLGDYLYDRVEVKHQPKVGTYLTDLEQLTRFTEAPTLQINSRVMSIHSCYDDVLYKVIADVDEKTQSLAEIIQGLVYDAVVAAATVISVVLPPVGIALSVVLLTKGLVQGVEAYNDGDRAKALSHFKDALIELATLGKAGYSRLTASKLQNQLIVLLGSVYSVEKFYAEATGQPRLHERALEVIQEILDDPESMNSTTTVV